MAIIRMDTDYYIRSLPDFQNGLALYAERRRDGTMVKIDNALPGRRHGWWCLKTCGCRFSASWSLGGSI